VPPQAELLDVECIQITGGTQSDGLGSQPRERRQQKALSLSLPLSPSLPPSLPPSLSLSPPPLSLARAHRGLGGPELLVRLVTQQGTHAQRIVQPLRLLGQLAPQLGPLALEAAHSLPEQLQQRSGGHRDGTDRQQPSV
jgi:hypothetical protein